MNQEEEKLRQILQDYLHKLDTKTMTCQERINLIEFYMNDPSNTYEFDPSQTCAYLILGWYISSLIK